VVFDEPLEQVQPRALNGASDVPAQKGTPAPRSVRTAEELGRALETAEHGRQWLIRERNTRRAELQDILIRPSDPAQLADARKVRDAIAELDTQLELAAEQLRALHTAIQGARERSRSEEWLNAQAAAEFAGVPLRAAAAALLQWTKDGGKLIESLALKQSQFLDTLRPTGASLTDKSLLPQIPQLVAMNLFCWSNGMLPPPRQCMLNSYELQQRDSVADIRRRCEDLIATGLRCFEAPRPPHHSPSKSA
jgi:hypothetical protein